MRIIARSEIDIGPRQRSEIATAPLNELKASILARGLLSPPVVRLGASGRYSLVAGGRRLAAIDSIAGEELFFLCDGKTVLPAEVPIIEVTDLSSADLCAAELEENIIRVDLPWQDRDRALVALHEMRKAENPDQSVSATAQEIAIKSGSPTAAEPGESLRGKNTTLRTAIAEAQLIAPHLNDPTIRNARTHREAVALVAAKEENAFRAMQIERRKSSSEAQSPSIEVRHGDAFQILPSLDSALADLIIADPPYGIGVDQGSFASRTVQHHTYSDTPEDADAFIRLALFEGFRLSKLRANIFIFTDIDRWETLQTLAKQSGWTPFRTPIIWAKSDSEGLAPWGRNGFRRTYELIFFATKGQRGLLAPPVDILRHNRVSRKDREYGPEKPTTLIAELIDCSTLPGDFVLDPCCGSGSTLVAARKLGRRALGIELDERAFNIALVRANSDEELTGQLTTPALETL